MRILIVEDDELLANLLKQGLQLLQYTVDVASSAEQAKTFIDSESFDLAVVDVVLPKASGLHLIRELRSQNHLLPILVLSSLTSTEDVVRGLDAGADDYMSKPYELNEIAARIRALLRRAHTVRNTRLDFNRLSIDISMHAITFDGEIIELTRREWDILEILITASPGAVSKTRLINNLAGWDKDITPNAIEVHLHRLRHKLLPCGIVIHTMRGIGYRVELPKKLANSE